MGTYDVMQVCENGHKITHSYVNYPEHRQSACDQCGADTIHRCPECDEPIRGKYLVEGVAAMGGPDPPDNCHECGEPYPWTTVPENARKEVQQVIREGESETNEFKRELPNNLREIPKEVVALANRQGGTLLLGVDDNGDTIGLSDIETTEQRVTGTLNSNVEPKIRVSIEKKEIEGKDVLVVHIPEADDKPYNVDGSFYIRSGTSVEKMSSEDLSKWFPD